MLLCGIDEAGRGPLAGPVCAAAVILAPEFPADTRARLNDSKKLSAAVREELKIAICRHAKAWGIGWATHTEIDTINIHNATLLAMARAFSAMQDTARILPSEPIHAITDGLFTPDIPAPCQALVKADTSIPEVMAASILAKTARDHLMEYYGIFLPHYGYERHKGYPTKAHREAILHWGPSPIQRLSFACR